MCAIRRNMCLKLVVARTCPTILFLFVRGLFNDVSMWGSSSSYCWASVANARNVLQPYWLIVLPLNVPALATSLLYEILVARVGFVYIDLLIFGRSNFRHWSSSRDPSSQRWNYIGEKWPMNFALKCPTSA